jgi:lysophospholipase L1-like esterase
MINTSDNYERLGYFSLSVAADSRRKEFDIKNHTIIRGGKKPDFLFVGDSITQYWELNAYFNIPGQLIVNRGIAGDTSTYLNKRFLVDVLQLKPIYCILGIGINDSIDLEGDYWKLIPPLSYESVISRAKENIREIIEKAKDSATTLILTSLLPISIKLSLYETERKSFVCDLNQWLACTAKHENLIFVNYYTAAAYPGTNKLLDTITYDGLHPNAMGYELMAAVL